MSELDFDENVRVTNNRAAAILHSFRSQGMSYGEGIRVLDCARTALECIGDLELSHLPIADGISEYYTSELSTSELSASYDLDALKLSSKRIT